jgi:hypothetical protein
MVMELFVKKIFYNQARNYKGGNVKILLVANLRVICFVGVIIIATVLKVKRIT